MMFGDYLAFDPKKHVYTFAGKPVPGVTSILQCIGKPALLPWASKMASQYFLDAVKQGRTDYDAIAKESSGAYRREAKAAADIGHNVHSYAECYFKKQDLPAILSPQAQRGIDAFHSWLDSHDIEVVASERRVFSKEYYYAGTCDFVAKIDGLLGVGDIKTSSGIYHEMRFQTAAYQHALEEEKGMKFPVRWIIRFDKKTGEFEAKEFYDFEKDFKGFTAALALHRALQSMG